VTNPRRVDGLEITPVEDGFMIYQPDKDRVHYLNHTAVLVLELSDGRRVPKEIAALLQQAYKLNKLPLKEVDEALATMTAEGLLDTRPVGTPSRRGVGGGVRKRADRKRRG
jgi:Coenzyme PQQ synthesis protein D (PqqD)